MRSKNLLRIILFLALCIGALTSGSQVNAKGNAQSATPPPVTIVTRGLTYWDAIYIGNVSSTRYENWPFAFSQTYSFSITATATSGDLVPLLILFDGNNNEISRATNVLTSTQPIGNYSVQIQPAFGSGTYSLTIRQVAATPTPSPTNTPVFTSTPVATNTPIATNTPVFTSTPIATNTPVTTNTPVFTNTPVVTNTPVPTGSVVPSTTPSLVPTATVNLNNVPAGGFASAEFTCTFNPLLVGVSNITATGLFGADAVMVVNGPQNGSFIVAIAGSNGNKATTSGAAFTFSVNGLLVGQSAIDCQARVSTGNLALTTIPSTPANLTITSSQGTLAGKVIASKPVTVTLFNPNNSVAGSVTANADGTFILSILPGTYTAVASAPGHLKAQGSVTITGGNTATLQMISLLAGDIDGNDVIDQFDALTIGINYNAATPTAADLNNDGIINVLDMEILAKNYRQAGALAWQ
jgi:hypothetical protein